MLQYSLGVIISLYVHEVIFKLTPTMMQLHQQTDSTIQSFWASKAPEYLVLSRTWLWQFATLSQDSFTPLLLQELLRVHVPVYWGIFDRLSKDLLPNIFAMVNNGA